MALTPDPSATIEQLHAEVKASGTPEQQALADELLYGYNNVGINIEVSLRLHRDAMANLLGEVNRAPELHVDADDLEVGCDSLQDTFENPKFQQLVRLFCRATGRDIAPMDLTTDWDLREDFELWVDEVVVPKLPIGTVWLLQDRYDAITNAIDLIHAAHESGHAVLTEEYLAMPYEDLPEDDDESEEGEND
jgi:hypothetical protein